MRSLTAVLALASLIAARGARADDGPTRIRQEWLGVEMVMGGYVTDVSNERAIFPDPEGPHTTAGWGGFVRLGRHHFGPVYWTPVAIGLFEGHAGSKVGFMAAQTELGGSVLSRGRHALDLGLAVGLGFMGVHIGGGCDGSCSLGGGGTLVAPVVRYVYTTPAGASLGLSARWLRPMHDQTGGEGPYGIIRGPTSLLTVALDVAYGSF